MTYKYDHTIYITVARQELACEIVYSVTPGLAGDRVDPPYGPEVEIYLAEVVTETWRFGKKLTERKPVTGWLLDLIANDPDINADLLSEAGEEDASRADAAAEMLWEDRRSA
jgi:hypothetical protein